jgi:hypothetical protein
VDATPLHAGLTRFIDVNATAARMDQPGGHLPVWVPFGANGGAK